MYLIFDITANGKPTNYKASFSDVTAWPRLIHLSWILLDAQFKPIEDYDCCIIPEGFVLDEKVLAASKLTQEDFDKKGVELEKVLDQFNESAAKAQYVFAHNLSYNENVLGAEFMRCVKNIQMFKLERFCLMQESTYYCKLPARGGGYKWPSLPELHAACFSTTYAPANNARADVIAATRCFIKLMKTGQLEDLFE